MVTPGSDFSWPKDKHIEGGIPVSLRVVGGQILSPSTQLATSFFNLYVVLWLQLCYTIIAHIIFAQISHQYSTSN